MGGVDRWKRAVLLKTASKRVWRADRQLRSIDLKLSWASVRAGAGVKYIFAQGCCLGAIERISLRLGACAGANWSTSATDK
ncbi:hypothetical protein QUA56_12235 [Microcoleus sp. N3A4]|uniref:hypothetical protein n=1 Tax=Microcoleus sp. N3A4 TaxID=3055379 RepID=UPI002FD2CCFE